jgi:hypothetical protein
MSPGIAFGGGSAGRGARHLYLPPVAGQDTAVDPAQCTITVVGGGTSVASGASKTLRLQLKNAAAQNLSTAAGLSIVPTKAGGSATGTLSAITDNGDGTIDWTYTGIVAGTAQQMGATINTAPVTGSAATLSVTPGAISLANSLVTVSPASSSQGGSASLATLTAYDAAGNLITQGGATVLFASSDATYATTGGTSDHSNGTYTTPVTPVLQGGPVTISAKVGGLDVVHTASFTITAQFTAGDLLNNISFEDGDALVWGGFRDGSGGTAFGADVSRSATRAKDGVKSVKRVLQVDTLAITSFTATSPCRIFSPGHNHPGGRVGIVGTGAALDADYYSGAQQQGTRFLTVVDADHLDVFTDAARTVPYSSAVSGTGGSANTGDHGPTFAFYTSIGGGHMVGYDALRFRFWFFFDGLPTSNLKFQIYENDGFNGYQYGGLYYIYSNGVGYLGWLFGTEAVGPSTRFALAAPLVGQWNSFECHYRLNGDTSNGGADQGFPSVAMWLNDVNVDSKIGSFDPGTASFVDVGGIKYLNAGKRAIPSSATKLYTAALIGILNRGNTNLCNLWVDRVSLSTLGRLGS